MKSNAWCITHGLINAKILHRFNMILPMYFVFVSSIRWFSSNAAKLHHYVLVVTRPSAPLGEGTRTRISYSGESYVFQGFSVFFHRELPGVLPRMPVSRWTSEYEFHFEKAPMLDCFTVEELNMFHRYVFVDLLELYDESLRAFGVNDGCPVYHVMPRFISERGNIHRICYISFGLLPTSESLTSPFVLIVLITYIALNFPTISNMSRLVSSTVSYANLRAVQLSAPKVIPCSGFLATGIYADMPAHVLLLILAVKHARFHWSLAEFEKIISYTFANRSVVELAFTHPSYKNDFGKPHLYSLMYYLLCGVPKVVDRFPGLSKIAHNERLEYLGDAVVELIVSNRLFFILPHQEEGGLATYRSALVQNRNLAALGKKLRLGDWMMYAHGIDLCDEEDFRKSLANTFEAVLGAIYLDGGIEECDRIFAEAMFGDDPMVKMLWLNVPEHPLKVEQPEGDRMFIEGTDDLAELSDLEDILGFRFQNIRLLAKALTRRNVPYNTLTCGNNQRLEWLGDAVLQLIISDYLYHHFPNHHEGHLSLLRTCLVCNETQSQICEDLGLHNYIVHPPGGSSRLPELSLKDKADLVEALIGAIFVDRGWDYCRAFIYICFLPRLKHFIDSKKWNDSKSQLQQCCLALRDLDANDSSAPEMPEYRTIGIEGSTNARHYRVAVYFRNMRLAVGEANTVHLAQMDAAKKALEKYKDTFSSISRNNVKNFSMRHFRLVWFLKTSRMLKRILLLLT
ncbi:unnamed protein product [Angiostrongylus costaricensis]|uniref:RNase III domain-containing protein n=1 Tax=Angiostrongylus costaricensis TaxID=334426 RepID=A0A0R3PTM1_ANGCS|nr:unnamed protein product [Angiostrongylus costaricensis]